MNQTCKVCGEPAAGFHFGAFTCEGCKSFFGRSYNNLSSISECKNNGKCIIDKKNRTACKACRLRKCYTVGMSKGGSRYGRRSNWFKIHCLLQEQQQQAFEAASKVAAAVAGGGANCSNDLSAHLQQQQQRLDQQQRLEQQQQQRQEQQQQRLSSLAAAQHMGGLLGYHPAAAAYHSHPVDILNQTPSAASPFMSAAAAAAAAAARHPAAAAEAAAFFSMMNSLPNIGAAASQSAFPLPPHLLFPYHSNAAAAAAAAAADAAYRSEMYRHRQSVDSMGSAGANETSNYSPPTRRTPMLSTTQSESEEDERRRHSSASSLDSRSASPELCVSGEDEVETECMSSGQQGKQVHFENMLTTTGPTMPGASSSPISVTHIHSPIAIRATPKSHSISPQLVPGVPTPTPTPTSASSGSQPRTPEPQTTHQHHHHLNQSSVQFIGHHHSATQSHHIEQTALAFAAKMQSLSPVSVCSIGTETCPVASSERVAIPVANEVVDSGTSGSSFPVEQQDGPMDLSVKTATPNVSVKTHETVSEQQQQESLESQNSMTLRRKFYQLDNDNEGSAINFNSNNNNNNNNISSKSNLFNDNVNNNNNNNNYCNIDNNNIKMNQCNSDDELSIKRQKFNTASPIDVEEHNNDHTDNDNRFDNEEDVKAFQTIMLTTKSIIKPAAASTIGPTTTGSTTTTTTTATQNAPTNNSSIAGSGFQRYTGRHATATSLHGIFVCV